MYIKVFMSIVSKILEFNLKGGFENGRYERKI